MYVPRVYYHPNEEFFPEDIDTFVNNFRLVWSEPNYGDPSCDEKLLAVGSELKGALLDYTSWRPASSIMLELIKNSVWNPAKTAQRW